jgi:hypothetical protein
MKRLLPCAVALAACGTEIDPAGLPSIEGYTAWPHFEQANDIPGHPESVRVIYKNEVAASYPHGGRYPIGTVILKEIFDRNDDGSKGGLRYIAVMRKLGDDSDQPTNEGWLFTYKDGDSETQLDLCWHTCHRAGPYDGAWFDYGD